MNGVNKFGKTDGAYSLVPTDDLLRFWRSKVKATAGHGKCTHVDAGASKSIFWLWWFIIIPIVNFMRQSFVACTRVQTLDMCLNLTNAVYLS